MKSTTVGLALALCFIGGSAGHAVDEPAGTKGAPATLAGHDFLTLSGAEWKLLWNDEFDGDRLNAAKWSIGLPWKGTDGTNRHHNDQYASYIMDDDVRVQGGALHLTTQRRDVTGANGRVFRYTEGLITTSGKFRTSFGYFEMRAKLPTEAGPGTWPAFWTLSDGWPPEFDILEYWGSDNRIHQGPVTRKPDGGQRWDSYHRNQVSLSGWHTYGMEWGPGYQRYNIDGKITNVVYGGHLPDVPHYLLLNSGVESARPPRPGTTFPNDFVVDYVRVYARPDVPALLNGDFESDALAPWGRWNEAAAVDYGARSGKRALRVDAGGRSGAEGASSVQQTVYGLKPNSRYTLTAFARTTGGAAARLGVKEHGSEEARTPADKGTADYRPLSLTFTTGPDSKTATVYCWAEGDGSAFFDDVRLERAPTQADARVESTGPLPLLRAAEALPLVPAVPGRAVAASAPLTLAPDSGTWDLSRRDSVYLRLRNPGKERVTVWARAENPAAKGVTDNVRTAAVLEPGETETMRLRLMRRPEDPTYAPFKPFFMYYKDINVRDNTVDPVAIARIVIWLEHPTPGQSALVESVTAEGEGVPAPVPFFPFVDRYGQYKHTDWPDKIYTDADFAASRKKDQAEMSAYPGPPDWNEWGGWKNGPKQEATGFFYPKKVDGKWWLVDPSGALFWSYGPTGVGGGGEGSPVTDKERWFEELPSPDGPFGQYWGEDKGARFMYYQDGKTWKSFSFSGANAHRKYGPDWREATADALHSRLRNWGLNSMGNWSDPVVYLRRKTPYTVAISSGGPMLEHIPDVFDPAWVRSINERMDQELGKSAGDPWNIGYFVDNEWTWGSQARGIRVTHGVVRAAASSASKQAFIGDLKAKYGDIASLNAAWGTGYASWEALMAASSLPERQNARFNEDAGDFGVKFAEKYFSTVRDAVKRVAPNNLYLGVRFHGHIDRSLVQLAAKYCDVISYNIYEEPNGRLNQYRGVVDKPFIVGEFGVTSDLGQMPWRGQIYSEEQGARLRPLERYLAQAFVHPALVGAHFFQFRDQPLTGRPDGEATLRGFLNVADTPHFDLVQVNRRLAYKLYETRGAATSGAGPSVPVSPRLSYQLAEGSERWDAEKRRRILEAMDSAVALYNEVGRFDKNVTASYNAGVPTADGNFNGSIRFGGQIGRRTALHELGHVLGVGTHPRWQSFIKDGKWTGAHALAQLREFDGPDAVLHADRQHFWPYGLNFDRESSPEMDRRHVMMVAAFQRDLGIAVGQPIQGMVGVGTWATQAEFKDIRVTRNGQALLAADLSRGLHGWKTIRGQWQVVDGTLRQTGSDENARALIGDPAWRDYTLTLKARKLGGKEGFLILFGTPDEETKSWWNLGGWDNTQHAIELPGVSAPRIPGSIETGRWYDIRVEVQGSSIKCYLDGKLVQQATR